MSASDASRIGRLVLPKACAEVSSEAYNVFSFEAQHCSFFKCPCKIWQFTGLFFLLMQAYFPPINQSEGLPLKIQDVKGNEWTFQFRFWPNNNSRMYVLEGVTPCIQSMQLQAGDTGMLSLGYHLNPHQL